MNKSLLIIKREYLTRIRKKTFLISTILFPVLYLGIIFGGSYIAKKTSKVLRVAVIDSSGVFDRGQIGRANLLDSSSYLDYVTTNVDSIRHHFAAMGYDGYLVVPPMAQEGVKNLTLVTDKSHGLAPVYGVQNKLNTVWSGINYNKFGVSEQQRSLIEQNKINLSEKNINDEKSNSGVATGIGYMTGFLMYLILLIYGSQVMMGVMEEKTNRIAEVMVSSIRPFQLMLGKIIGIGLVALTQFLLWVVFAVLIYNVTKASGGSNNAVSGMVGEVDKMLGSINAPFIVFCFAFYMLAGFFFYSALFAAIGSSVNEDMREAQSLSFPITMLIIFSIGLMAPVIADPSGKLAFWASIIPFSSPILMMARIPFGIPGTVPWWQLGLSMALLIAGFLFTTWFAGKIYRTGILMYGKKPSWKEMMKWAFRK